MAKSASLASDPVAGASSPVSGETAGAGIGAGCPGYGWLDERLGLCSFLAHAKEKTVPQHSHTFWYYWGGISLFFFLIQAISGILLLIYYRPGTEAHESVRQITYEIDFGWLIRSAHAWSANLMILTLFVHMFSVFFMKAYRKPREFGWWSGLLLLALTFLFGFSGYLLPFDELSFFATKVGLDIPQIVPGLGPVIVTLVQGGEMVTEVTIQRFFALHVVVLPLVFIALLAFHLWLVQKHGNAVPPKEAAKPKAERRTIPFFPNFFAKDLAMWLIALNVMAILASLYPWGLGPPADPAAPAPEGIHPEWYFMSQFQVLKWLGRWIPGAAGELAGIAFFGMAALLWTMIPFYDNDSQRALRARTATWFGFVMMTGLLVSTLWAYIDL